MTTFFFLVVLEVFTYARGVIQSLEVDGACKVWQWVWRWAVNDFQPSRWFREGM